MDSRQPALPMYYTYETAPDSPELRGTGVTTRMLRRLVEQKKIPHHKFGLRTTFSSDDLRAFVDASARPAEQ